MQCDENFSSRHEGKLKLYEYNPITRSRAPTRVLISFKANSSPAPQTRTPAKAFEHDREVRNATIKVRDIATPDQALPILTPRSPPARLLCQKA